MTFEAIPAELRERAQWVLWRYETRDGKPTKVPLIARLPKNRGAASGTQRRFPASTTDPRTWRGFEEARAVWRSSEGFFDGIGYVFAADDPFAGVDLDDCMRDSGELHAEAAAIALHLASYTEHSPSRQGVHVITQAVVNGRRNRTGKTAWGGGFEVYDRGRFFCVTGDRLPHSPATIEPRQAELDELLGRMFPPPATMPTGRPLIDLDDHELLARANAAKNGAGLERLYRGDWSAYSSQSEADLALCTMLAFWAGPDPARIDRLFRGSGLIRGKWDERHHGDGRTYGEGTVARALEGRTDFYDWTKHLTPNEGQAVPTSKTAEPSGEQQSTHERQNGNGAHREPEADADVLRDLSLAEVLARELPAEQWIVENLIAPATIGFLHGLPETMKTFLALHIGMSVARAVNEKGPQLLLGKLRITDPGPVGYIWQDDSEVEELRRIQTVARAMAVEDAPMYFMLNRGLRIDNPEHRERIAAWIRHRGLKLVFIDSLKDFITAGSTKDDTWVTTTINALKLTCCDEAGAAIKLVHHDGKPNADTSSRSAGQTMHGSVFLEATARSGLHCQRPDAAKPEVRVTRWGNSGKSWGPDLLRLDEDTCELELIEIAHNALKVAPVQYTHALREAGGGMYVDELAQALGVGTQTALKHLQEAGVAITKKKRGKTSPNYAQLVGEQDAFAL